ncbi:unnamed protein product [Lactuca virosa]|uniref:F-box domain-containing protein n=1 Tax=Lactuca virosa TaxID=75947 RepID=A0AAU9PED0_9ASTR|nr:unnamed protein product [Lactuca virosa]
MSSTTAPEPFSAMNESVNWLEMREELMTNILQRLDTKELLTSILKVCTTWRIICKDPTMWKIIRMNKLFDHRDKNYVLEIMTKQAVDLSCGELIDHRYQCRVLWHQSSP